MDAFTFATYVTTLYIYTYRYIYKRMPDDVMLLLLVATSSEALVTCSDALVTCSDALVTCSDALVTCSDALVTCSDALVTCRDALVTSCKINTKQHRPRLRDLVDHSLRYWDCNTESGWVESNISRLPLVHVNVTL